ncbi:MAG: signal peptidase I [Actinobacteria bacterium]|nr:signal peptidase I [Actinomycetota bacterium]
MQRYDCCVHLDDEAVESFANQTDVSIQRRFFAKLREFLEWFSVIGVALTVAIVIRVFLLQQFYISGPSMETTMFSDNRVLVNKLAYRIGEIERGDVVVFDRAIPNGNEIQHDDLIKRVIALGGETISISKCVVFIDGVELAEPYLPNRDTELTVPADRCSTVDMEPIKIESDEIFLMGDNRPQSFDSRMFGPIKKDLVIGQAFVLLWPLREWKLL